MKKYETGDKVSPIKWKIEVDEDEIEITVDYPTSYGYNSSYLSVPIDDVREWLERAENTRKNRIEKAIWNIFKNRGIK
jgi:hypothetical protein